MIRYRNIKRGDVVTIINHLAVAKNIDFLDWENTSLFDRHLKRNHGICKIAIDSTTSEIAGFIFGGDTGLRGVLHHLYVDPGYRKQGIGENLIKLCVEEFRTNPRRPKRLVGLVYGSSTTIINILKRIGFILNPELDKSLTLVIPMHIDL